MKQKTYQTTQPKKSKTSFTISTNWLSVPNKLHLDAQIHHTAKVYEDRRFKKPKHKNKEIYW